MHTQVVYVGNLYPARLAKGRLPTTPRIRLRGRLPGRAWEHSPWTTHVRSPLVRDLQLGFNARLKPHAATAETGTAAAVFALHVDAKSLLMLGICTQRCNEGVHKGLAQGRITSLGEGSTTARGERGYVFYRPYRRMTGKRENAGSPNGGNAANLTRFFSESQLRLRRKFLQQFILQHFTIGF